MKTDFYLEENDMCKDKIDRDDAIAKIKKEAHEICEYNRWREWQYHPSRVLSQKDLGWFSEEENKTYRVALHKSSRDVGVDILAMFKQEEKDIDQMELRDTINLMCSMDYKDRFKAEYYQTKIRYNGLHKMIVKYEADKLDFTPDCPLELLQEQAACMGNYLHKLEIRAEIEDIKL